MRTHTHALVHIGYRMSKAGSQIYSLTHSRTHVLTHARTHPAVNMAGMSLHKDLCDKKIHVGIFHPGMVMVRQ